MRFRKFTVMLLGALSLFLVACDGGKTETSAEDAVIRDFLNTYWTQDEEGRYQAFAEASATSDEEEMKKATTAYYETIAQYVDADVLEELKANRMPCKYEALAEQTEASYIIQDIQLEEKEDEMYHFEISFLWEQPDEETLPVTASGDIRMIKDGDAWKIDYYYESNVFPELEW